MEGLGGGIILRDVGWEDILWIGVGAGLALVLDHHLDDAVLHRSQ